MDAKNTAVMLARRVRINVMLCLSEFPTFRLLSCMPDRAGN